ncbi:MAG: penicillin-binding protein activator [Xanthomonadaceae bacterium]|nr:penicillin-binding protein activator [Xanthomonadaceae bacterium]
MTIKSASTWIAVCLFASACSSTKTHSQDEGSLSKRAKGIKAPSLSAAATAQEKTTFEEIQTLYRAAKYDDAVKKSEDFETQFPEGRYVSDVYNLRGLIFLGQKKAPVATIQFRKAIEKNPNQQQIQYLIYNLATAQFDSKQYLDALKSLDQILVENLDENTKLKFYFLKSRILHAQGQLSESLRAIFEAGKLLQDSKMSEAQKQETRVMFYNQSETTSHEIKDVLVFDALLKEFVDNQLADCAYYHAGKLSKDASQNGLAETYLRQLVQKYPNSVYIAQAQELINVIQSKTKVEPRTIGVLLPLTGKYAKFGYQALYGIQLAVNLFNQEDSDTKMTLAIADAGETPEQGEAGFAKLFYDDHVAVVIGPLLSKGIESLSKRASENGVPLVSLAQQPGFRDGYVFQMGLTTKNQVEEVARYALEKASMKNFAVIYPSNQVGTDAAFHFWDLIEARGGKIAAFESYQPREVDFRASVDKALGIFYPDARKTELDELAAQRTKDNIAKRTRITEKYFVLKPQLDFDGVLILDEAKVATQIMPTFVYRDAEQLKYLGTSTWNTSSLVERAPELAESCTFVDSYFAENQETAFKNFVEKFNKTYGYIPAAAEAMAYDAGQVVVASIKELDGVSNRSDLKDQLMKFKDYPGATGLLSYVDGAYTHQLKVLTVKGKKIVQVP